MKQNWYAARFYFIGLIALTFTFFNAYRSYGQCINVKDPQTGQWTNSPKDYRRCPTLTDPIPGTVNIQFQSPASNFTIVWGDGTTTTYPGPQSSVSYTYNTANLFKFKIVFPGCPDTLFGVYVNERNVTAGGVSVPGVGFIVPPAGITNKRCVPEDLTIINASPNMNGYTRWIINWGDQKRDTIGYEFMKAYTHTYLKGTTGCSLKISITYSNACNVNPVNRPNASYGDYFFKDIDSAAVSPASVFLCQPADVTIRDISKLNCLDSLDRELKWYRVSGFASPLPYPGNDVFRPYNNPNRTMNITAASLLPIPPDSTYRLRMVIRNTCGADSADATIRIVAPTKPVFNVINDNTCPGEQMNFANNTSHRPYQSYIVNYGDGTQVTMGFFNTFSHTYAAGGTYKVKMTTRVNGYNGQTCSLSDSIYVTVKTTITPGVIVNPKLACDSLTVTVKNTSINTAGVVWKGWDLGGGNTAGSGVMPSLVNNAQVQVMSVNMADSTAIIKYKMYGRYTVKLRAQSLGCPELAASDTIFIYPSPTLRWKVTTPKVCLGNPVIIRDSSRVIETLQRSLKNDWNHISWTLQMGDGTIYTSASNITSNFDNVQGTNRLTSHTYSAPGNYWVKLTVKSPNRCAKVDSFQVQILPAAVPNLTWVRDVCNPGQISIQNITTGSADKYEFIFKRGANFFAKVIRLAKDTFTYNLPYFPPGDSTFYYLTIRTISGTSPDTCSAISAPFLIKIPPSKQAGFSASDLDGCTPLNNVLFTNQSIGIPSDGSHIFNWNFGNGQTFTGENPPLQNYINNGTTFKKDTVRLTITSNGSCVYSTFKVITIYPKANPAIVAPNEVCHNNTIVFSATGNGLGSYLWSFAELDGTSSTQATPTRNFINTGNSPISYTIRLLATTVAGCSDSTSKSILVNPRPTASFVANPEAACGATPVDFDASTSLSAATYSWNFSDGTAGITDTSSSHAIRFFPENITNLDRVYNVTLRTNSNKGCESDPFTRQVRIRPTVIANFFADRDSACSPVAVNFTNLSTPTANQYTWYVNELGQPGLGIPNTANQPNNGFRYVFTNNSYTTATRYVVTLVVKNDAGTPVCESQKSVIITVLPKPLAAFTRNMVSPSSLCSPVSMQVKASGSKGATGYYWTFSDAATPITASDSIPFFKIFENNTTAIQNHFIQLVVNNAFGCTDTTKQTMNIRPRVLAAFTADKTIGCSPLVVGFTNTSTPSAVSYTWYNNGLPTFFAKDLPNQTFLNNSATDTAKYVIYVVARGEGDVCTDTSAKITIRVLPKPLVLASASPANGCSPLTVTLSASGTQGGIQYAWYAKKTTDPSYTLISTQANANPLNHIFTNATNAAINYQIKLVVTGLGSCQDSAFSTVTVFPEVNPSFTAASLQGCAPLKITFVNTTPPVSGTSFIWKVDSIPQFNPFPTTFTYTFNGQSDTANTTYVVSLTAISGSGCSREVFNTVTVFPKPSPDFLIQSQPLSACSPVSARFIPQVKGQILSYEWVYDQADSMLTTQDTAVFRNYFNSTATPFNHQIKLKVMSNMGCEAATTKNLLVNPKVTAGFIQSAQSGCSPLPVTFTNSGSSAGANVFDWYVDGVLVSNSSIGFTQNFTNNSFSSNRVYTIKLVARNNLANACVDTAVRFVTVFKKPEPAIALTPNNGCSPLRVQFSAGNSQGVTQYAWYSKLSTSSSFQLDTTTSNANPFFRQFTNPTANVQVYDNKLIVTGPDGCQDSTLSSVSVAPGLQSNFTVTDTVGCAPLAVIFGNATTTPGANQFSWLIDGQVVSNSPAFLNYSFANTSYTNPRSYLVQMIAANSTFGCPDTASVIVRALPVPVTDISLSQTPLSGCSPVQVTFQPVNSVGVQTFTWTLPDTVVTTMDTAITRQFVNNAVVPQVRWATLKGANAFGCSYIKNASFQVNPRVVAGFTVSKDSVCSPAQIVFTNTSSPGVNVAEWYINGIFKGNSLSAIAETFVNNDSLPKTFTIKLIVRNSITPACEDMMEKVITIFPKPLGGSIFALPENGCSPLLVRFTGSASFATHFIWNFGNGVIIDTTGQVMEQTFTNLNPILNTQFPVSQVAINSFGCSDTARTQINVRPNVTAAITASDTLGCSPLSVAFSGASSLNANNYLWIFPDGTTATGVNVNRLFTNTSDSIQTHRIRLITDRVGVSCPDTASILITVLPKPIAAFDANPLSGCQPLPVQFVNNSQLAQSGYWVITNGPQIDTLPMGNFDRTFTNTTPLNQVVKVELFVQSALGCKDQTSRLITVSPFVDADFIQSADSGCSPLPVNFTNLSAPGSASSWYVDGVLVNNASGQFSYTFVNNQQISQWFEVKLVVNNVLNTSCTDTMVRWVKVFPKPVAGTLGAVPDNGCSPIRIGFFSNALGATQFSYDFNDGSILDTNAALAYHTFVNNAGLTVRNFNVRLTVKNDFGCTDLTSKLVSIKPTVTAVIASSDSIGCTPLSVSLSGLSSVNSNTYDWDFGDGTQSVLATPVKVFNNLSDSIQHYTIRLITDRTGVNCPDTTTFPITVYPKPVAEFAPNPLVGCNPLHASLVNLTTGAISGTWQFNGNGNFVTHPVTAANFDTTFVNPNSNQNMVVDLSLIAVNSLGCVDTKTRAVTIYPAVQAQFTQSADSGCSPLKVRFTNQSLPGNLVQWLVDGQVVSASLNNFDYIFQNNGLQPKVFEVKMIARAALANECQDTVVSFVKVFPKPAGGSINAMPEIACSPARIDFVGTAQGASQYIWNFGDGAEVDTTVQELFHVFANSNAVTNRNFVVRQVSVNSWGCSDTARKTITIRPTVIAAIFSNDSLGCSPYTAAFSASPSTNANQFEWDFGDGGTSNLMNPSHIFTNNSDSVECHRVRLIARKSGVECADTAWFTVCVQPLPTAAFNINPISGCQPLQVSLVNQSYLATTGKWTFISGGLQTEVFSWNYDTTVANPSAQIKTVRVILTATTAAGCTSKLERQFTVAPFTQANFAQSVDSGCSPLPVTFLNLSAPGASAAWFIDGNPVSSSNNSFNYTLLNNSTQIRLAEVKLIVRNNLSPTCTDTIIKWIKVFPKPDAGIVTASPESGCSPLMSQFSASPSIGNHFIWDFRDGTVLDTNALVVSHTFVNYNPSANMPFAVRFIALTDKGCSDTTYKTVVVSPFTIARIGIADSQGCSPINTQLVGSLSQNANRFTWDFGDGSSTSFAANPVHTFTNNGQTTVDYTIRLIASRQGFDCPDTTYKTVRVFPNPKAKFTANTYAGCGPLTVQFTNTSELADSVMWVISSLAETDTVYTNAQTWERTFSNPFTQQMTVRVELHVWTANGCHNSLVRNIVVNPDVKPLFTAGPNGCAPLMVNFNNQSVNPGGAFQWNFGDGTPPSSAFAPSHVFQYNGAGDTTFTVTLLAISNPAYSPSCNQTFTQQVTVYGKPKPEFIITPEVLQLPETNVTFTNLTPYRPNWKFQWLFGDGKTDTSGSLTVGHDYAAIMNELTNTNVTVKLVAYNAFGCTDTVSRVLQIRPIKPIVDFGPDTAGCAPLFVVFKNYSRYGNQYFWTFGDGTTSTEQNPSKRYEQPGQYSVSLRVTGPGGETVLKKDNLITVFDIPDASFTTVPKAPRVLKIPEDKMYCFVRYPQPGWSYEWDFGDGTRSNAKDPVHQYKYPGNYTIALQVTSAEGCVARDTVKNGAIVEKGNMVIIPNAFTPRQEPTSAGYLDKEEGMNDIFYPFTEGVSEIQLQIFNRWGQFIYQSTTLNKGWDGTFNGSACKADVYVYKIWVRFVDGSTSTKVGDVTLLR